MKMVAQIIFFVFITTTLAKPSHAQTETLPKGIGIYVLGYRQFDEQQNKYDQNGELVSLGKPFETEFSFENMLSGKLGPDLKRLAEELHKFDANNSLDQSTFKDLSLGKMSGDVTANINARFFGIGYGLSKRLTIFFGVPWVEASSDTELYFTGYNNAPEIKQQIGDLAYDELKVGLERASQVSITNIKSDFAIKGYQDIDHWQHSGVGDIKTGTVYSIKAPLQKSLYAMSTLQTALNIPTGYVEDPDILTDFNIGKGYYSLTNKLSEKFSFKKFIWLGGDIAHSANFPTTIDKRVPEENENLVDQDRRVAVKMSPGDNIEHAGFIGGQLAVFSAQYRLGLKRHFSDQYSGPIVGNYHKLAENSASRQMFHEASLSLSTAELFQKKKFPVPLVLGFTSHVPISAINSNDERYYELFFASFFKTPYARKQK